MIDLLPEQLEVVKRILAEYVPLCEVRVFGSRIKRTAKEWSDLDLAVVGSSTMGRDALYDLKEAFEGSILPMQVDVLDWYTISPEFQTVINEDYEVIYEPA